MVQGCLTNARSDLDTVNKRGEWTGSWMDERMDG